MTGGSVGEAPTHHRSEGKGGEGGEAGADGEAAGDGQRKAEKDDVAGHVGDKDVTQGEVGNGVDDPGDRRQHHERGREGPAAVAAGRYERAPGFDRDSHHRHLLLGRPLDGIWAA